jgi:hypothetical protein
MESAKAEAVAGEGKAVTSERFRYEENCGAPEREEGKIEKRFSWSESAGRTVLRNAMFSAVACPR